MKLSEFYEAFRTSVIPVGILPEPARFGVYFGYDPYSYGGSSIIITVLCKRCKESFSISIHENKIMDCALDYPEFRAEELTDKVKLNCECWRNTRTVTLTSFKPIALSKIKRKKPVKPTVKVTRKIR